MTQQIIKLNKELRKLESDFEYQQKINPTKSGWTVTLLLSILFGWMGVDRFYNGSVGLGLLKLFTFGGLGYWYIIDIILILFHKMKDSEGIVIRNYNDDEIKEHSNKLKDLKSKVKAAQTKLEQELNQFLLGRTPLTEIRTNLKLKKGEKVVFKQEVELLEPRAIRVYKAGYAGTTIKLAGKPFRIGGAKGHSESHYETKVIDNGTLFLSDKRLIYTGQTKNYDIEYQRVLNIEYFPDGFKIQVQNRQKPISFIGTKEYEEMLLPVYFERLSNK